MRIFLIDFFSTLTIFLTLHLLYTLFFFSVLRDSLISSPCPGRHGGKPSSLSSSAASTKLTSLTSYRVISHTKMAQPNLRDRSLSSRLVAKDPMTAPRNLLRRPTSDVLTKTANTKVFAREQSICLLSPQHGAGFLFVSCFPFLFPPS